MKINHGQVPATPLSQVQRLFGNRNPRTEGEDSPAGDQWMVLEMWLSLGVGIGSEQNVNATRATTFQDSLAPPAAN